MQTTFSYGLSQFSVRILLRDYTRLKRFYYEGHLGLTISELCDETTVNSVAEFVRVCFKRAAKAGDKSNAADALNLGSALFKFVFDAVMHQSEQISVPLYALHQFASINTVYLLAYRMPGASSCVNFAAGLPIEAERVNPASGPALDITTAVHARDGTVVKNKIRIGVYRGDTYYPRSNPLLVGESSLRPWSELSGIYAEYESKRRDIMMIGATLREGCGTYLCAKQLFEAYDTPDHDSHNVFIQHYSKQYTGEFVYDDGEREVDVQPLADGVHGEMVAYGSKIADIYVNEHLPTTFVRLIHRDTCMVMYANIASLIPTPVQRKPYSKLVLSKATSQALDKWKRAVTKGWKFRLILLAGSSGFGKSSIAVAFAAAIKRPLIKISAGLLGLTAKDLAKSLKQAEAVAKRTNSIILLDDADFLFSSRIDDISRYALFQEVASFLDRSQVEIIATTNLKVIDEAILSRCDGGLYIDNGGINAILLEKLISDVYGGDKKLVNAVMSELKNESLTYGDMPYRDLVKVVQFAAIKSSRLSTNVPEVGTFVTELISAVQSWSIFHHQVSPIRIKGESNE